MALTLIGGGSRSGKSRHALELAAGRGSRLAFVATATPSDAEMAERIRRHQEERGPGWTTFEEPLHLASLIEARGAEFDAIVIDCMTLWLSNRMCAGLDDYDTAVAALCRSCSRTPADVFAVTNEVGCGIVPENELARRFRDIAGRANQQLAAAADAVIWMVFGIAMKVK